MRKIVPKKSRFIVQTLSKLIFQITFNLLSKRSVTTRKVINEKLYVPERTPNTILLYEFEFYFDYPKTQILRLLSIDAIFVGYHWSGTNSRSGLVIKKTNFHIVVDINNRVLSCMNMATIGSNSSLLIYIPVLDWKLSSTGTK